MNVILSICPLFIVIALGYVGGIKGFFPESFQKPANRLALYIAFPALLIRALAKAPLSEFWQPLQLFLAASAMLGIWIIAWQISKFFFKNGEKTRPTWIQTSVHGNHGFVGLAVIMYALGDNGVAAAGLMIGFLSILQNALTVITLSCLSGTKAKFWNQVKAIATNPIIIAICIGMTLSLAEIKLTGVVGNTLKILSGMGVPLALLIIGAKLSEAKIKTPWPILTLPIAMKLVLLPGLALLLLYCFGFRGIALTSSVLLLSSPTATLSVVFADQMGGDPSFASTMVSLSTALSAITFTLWLLILVP